MIRPLTLSRALAIIEALGENPLVSDIVLLRHDSEAYERYFGPATRDGVFYAYGLLIDSVDGDRWTFRQNRSVAWVTSMYAVGA